MLQNIIIYVYATFYMQIKKRKKKVKSRTLRRFLVSKTESFYSPYALFFLVFGHKTVRSRHITDISQLAIYKYTPQVKMVGSVVIYITVKVEIYE